MDDKKQLVAKEAIKYVESGMTLGLGSGSTVEWFLKYLSDEMKLGLNIVGVPTSKKTERLANHYGIPLVELAKETTIDLAVDGADLVFSDLNLLKGGGGSLVREKLIDWIAEKLVIIVDDSKMVNQSGQFEVPVEVLSFGWEKTKELIEAQGYTCQLRVINDETFISDNGNFILDCKVDKLYDLNRAHIYLKQITGVVDTGLFVNMVDLVMIGDKHGVREMNGS
ncbi:ribose 5-phosphate isomerase A [Alkalibacillus silvisoli]|uniref:Ribose-5-phosphate isomerase A n=1 Tax=Alkalibacillus silvisoli TaxID=392823 RepID=A0ABP3K4V8_9BACI